MMSSLRSDWATPRQLFEMLDREFHFTLDVCASEATATCKEWFGSSALERPWVPLEDGTVWCNPPYGRELGRWVEKAHREATQHFTTVVMLLPARTDTSWFHNYCLKGEIRFLRGRLAYDDGRHRMAPAGRRKAEAPFPSMIVIFWRGRCTNKKED
jgi:phage N-6-adenine-methyltransferase